MQQCCPCPAPARVSRSCHSCVWFCRVRFFSVQHKGLEDVVRPVMPVSCPRVDHKFTRLHIFGAQVPTQKKNPLQFVVTTIQAFWGGIALIEQSCGLFCASFASNGGLWIVVVPTPKKISLVYFLCISFCLLFFFTRFSTKKNYSYCNVHATRGPGTHPVSSTVPPCVKALFCKEQAILWRICAVPSTFSWVNVGREVTPKRIQAPRDSTRHQQGSGSGQQTWRRWWRSVSTTM